MFDNEILKGKNAFISGATGGIGKAIAIDLDQFSPIDNTLINCKC